MKYRKLEGYRRITNPAVKFNCLWVFLEVQRSDCYHGRSCIWWQHLDNFNNMLSVRSKSFIGYIRWLLNDYDVDTDSYLQRNFRKGWGEAWAVSFPLPPVVRISCNEVAWKVYVSLSHIPLFKSCLWFYLRYVCSHLNSVSYFHPKWGWGWHVPIIVEEQTPKIFE